MSPFMSTKRAAQPTVEAALAFQRRYGEAVGLDGSCPHLITGPMDHAAPLMFAIYDQSNGAPLLITPKWDDRACRGRRRNSSTS